MFKHKYCIKILFTTYSLVSSIYQYCLKQYTMIASQKSAENCIKKVIFNYHLYKIQNKRFLTPPKLIINLTLFIKNVKIYKKICILVYARWVLKRIYIKKKFNKNLSNFQKLFKLE